MIFIINDGIPISSWRRLSDLVVCVTVMTLLEA